MNDFVPFLLFFIAAVFLLILLIAVSLFRVLKRFNFRHRSSFQGMLIHSVIGVVFPYLKSMIVNTKPTFHPDYIRNMDFMTSFEKEYFMAILDAVNQKYYVFPQVKLDKVITTSQGEKNFKNPLYSKIDKKTLDFVLFDKIHFIPVLGIEIDDATHFRPDRVMRDNFVNQAMKSAEVPLLHLHSFLPPDALRVMIESSAQTYNKQPTL